MAKRSDFAQKLLDDLRLRKERMAVSQNSSQSNTLVIDAYAYSKQAHRGSRDMKTVDISSRNANLLSRSHSAEGVSNQMVAYGRGQQQQQIGDLSRALAFAFENRGKLRRPESSHANPILDFLQQIGRGTMNFVKVEKRSALVRQGSSSRHFPALSHFQIEEISKGAQRINQILKACSNGQNISIEIGKKLLQGAIDLEQSLRVLADLQDVSEYKITPKSKTKITLEEDDNDGDDNDTDKIIRHDQVDLPRFSFDKKSRHSQVFRETGKTDVNQNAMALTYAAQGRSSNKEKKDIAKLNSHRRSASSGSDVRRIAAMSEETNQLLSSKPKAEKGRISNVIAKLMGLDDPPENKDLNHGDQKDSSSKRNIEGITVKQTSIRSRKSIGTITKPIIADATNTSMGFLQKEKKFAQENSSSEIVNQSWKELGSLKVLTVPEKTSMRMDMQRDSNSGKYIYVKDRKEDPFNPKDKKQTHIYKKELVSNKEIPHMEFQKLKRSEGKTSLHKGKDSSRDIDIAGKRYLNEHGLPHRKPHSQRGIQNNAKQMLQLRAQRDVATVPVMKKPATIKSIPAEKIDAVEPKKNEDFTQLNVDMKETNKRKSDEVSYQSQSHGIVQVVEENHVRTIPVKEVKNTKIQKNDIPLKITEDVTGKSSISYLQKPAKHESFIVQGVKHGYGKLNVHRVVHQFASFKEPKTQAENILLAAKAESLNVTEHQKKEAKQPPTSSTSNEFQAKENHVAVVRVPKCENVILTPTHDHQDPFNVEEDLKANTAAEIAMDGTREDDTKIAICTQQANQDISGLTDSLTESENHLKIILIKSQTFLNTAEAVFKLNIPFDILDNCGQCIYDASSKLVLDCGYEVMKRKGIRQEVAVHPFMKPSISTVINIRTLDDLTKHIHRDIEKLKYYGRSATASSDIEDYLPKMLEYDVYNKDSDLNCMWDLGWNDTTFAFVQRFDVIREVEKQVLNGLLDEMTRDLLHIEVRQMREI